MPTSLHTDRHLADLQAAASRLGDFAVLAGLDALVPTCPTWDVRALVAHQTMVHRWATAQITGADPDAVPNQTTIREMIEDLLPYYAAGHRALVAALRVAPDELEAMRFLNDAPPPRAFWARRQAHETTIHAVDAQAAELGRVPTAAETMIDPALADDGIDELLRGFFTRGKSKLYDGTEVTIVVAPTDSARRWVLRVGERMTVDGGDDEPDGPVDATMRGTLVGIYLALWNRGDEIELSGRPELLSRWRAVQRVRWS